MAYVTYAEYTAFGYAAVPESEFERWEAMAEGMVRTHTFNRIRDPDLRPTVNADAETVRIAVMNQRGVCEVLDTLYIDAHPRTDAAKEKQKVVSFRNGKYSEAYAGSTQTNADETTPTIRQQIETLLSIYFTSAQLWRGVS